MGYFSSNDSFRWAFAKSIPFSTLLFGIVLAYFLSLSHGAGPSETTTVSEDDATLAYIDRSTAALRCLQADDGSERTLASCESEPATTPQSSRGRIIVSGIYALQWFCLNAQIALLLMARGKCRELDEAWGYLSDWSVNAGPMLGVLGTIISFTFLLADSGADGLAALFNVHFFDAAITTIMGGFIYVLCLLLTVWIGPAIKQ